MYQGLVKLALQHPMVHAIESVAVYSEDEFRMTRGTEGRGIYHVPEIESPGAVIGYYSIAWKAEGPPEFEFMTERQVQAIRARIKGSDDKDSPWVVHPEEMGKKTCLKRLLKRVPRTTQAAAALSADERPFAEQDADEIAISATPAPRAKAAAPQGARATEIPPEEPEVLEPEVLEPEEPEDDASPDPMDDPELNPPPREPAKKKARKTRSDKGKKKGEPAPPPEEEVDWDDPQPPAQDAQEAPGEEEEPEETEETEEQDLRPLNAEEKVAVREVLRKAGVAQAAKARTFLGKKVGREIKKLEDLNAGDLDALGVEL
jgi:hypothetical protein